jgi:hypothetical protein
MQSVDGEQSTDSEWNLMLQIAGAVLAFLLIASCGQTRGSATAQSIDMDRDVSLEGLIGHATSLAAIPSGGFVVAGSAWAVATNANGEVLWKYEEPGPKEAPPRSQSAFYGVVPLNNGNVLLCGSKQTGKQLGARLTILNSAGQLVEERLLQPPGPGNFYTAWFDRCLRWDDGVAVVGGGATDMAGFSWLMKLDGNGARQWDIVDQRLRGIDAVETLDHNLVMATDGVMPRSTNLIQVNLQGQIVSMKALVGYPDNLVRSAAPTSTLNVLANIDSPNTALLTLNGKFEEIASPQPTKLRMTINGCAWGLPDGSVAVFGNVFAQGGAYRSVVTRIGPGNRPVEARAFPLPSPQSVSASVYDAIPISARTFVAVRDVNNVVVLSRVTFK